MQSVRGDTDTFALNILACENAASKQHIGEIRSELLKTKWEMDLITARPFPKVGAYAVTWSNDLSGSTTPIS